MKDPATASEGVDILDLPPVKATHRISYGPDPQQFGDLFLPSSGKAPKLVIALHGGFWRAQYSLEHLSHLCTYLAHEGYAVWSLEYRRVAQPGGGFPGTFLDVAKGADFAAQLGTRFGVDARHVVTLGHSAGGHLALWLAARGRLQSASPLYVPRPLSVHGVVALAAVSDLAQAWKEHLGGGIVESLLGGTPQSEPGRYHDASPYELLPLHARQILIHGEDDDVVPIALSRRYGKRATAVGDGATVDALPKTGHFELIDPRASAISHVRDALQSLIS